MVLTKPELIAALQNEVRILLHLVAKIDRSRLDYRPTASQRSTLELVRYLSMMGPAIVRYALSDSTDLSDWTSSEEAAKSLDCDDALREIAAQHEGYAALLGGMSDADFRAEITDFDGNRTSRGAFIVNLVLCGCAAYRMQLFLYLNACGQEELNSANLWSGIDPVAA